MDMRGQGGPTMRVYMWDRCFIMQADSFALSGTAKPHKRLSATVMVANRKPFLMQIEGQPVREYQGVILAPNVSRTLLEADAAELSLFDAGITTASYAALQPCLRQQAVRVLDKDDLQGLRPLLSASFAEPMSCPQAHSLFDQVIAALGGISESSVMYDPRVQRVMRLVDELPLDELSLPRLAAVAELSESRLRALFQQNLGCAPAQYIRWVNTWKAIRLWEKGMKLTDVAHEMGFHDLAHIDHAVKELFGLSPSAATSGQGVSFHKCWR
jgi:AraC-like DNA-binding protein